MITGSRFTGATDVRFGSTSVATLSVDSDTQITAVSPAGSGTVDVTVTTPAGTSAHSSVDRYRYSDRPAVTGINPSSGPEAGGTTVMITGSRFTGATDVRFGSTSVATLSVDSDTQITAVSPAGSGTVDVTVTTPAGTSAHSSVDRYRYSDRPAVTGINPSSGPEAGGTTVMITGSRFTGATDVRFGSTSVATLSVDSDTQITAVSPAGSGTVDVTVTTPAGTSAHSSADRYRYEP